MTSVTLNICDKTPVAPNINKNNLSKLDTELLGHDEIEWCSGFSEVELRNNGFVWACCDAYNDHHNLHLRPDDVWLTILSQFGIYVTNKAEELRSKFVNFQDTKEIKVIVGEAGLGDIAQMFADGIGANLVSNMKDLVTPAFTTTTSDDKLVANLMLMCTMKKYFTYFCFVKCGLPSVTLYGTPADWERLIILTKRLLEFDNEEKLIAQWLNFLAPVLDNFLRTAQGDTSDELKSWWNRICHIKSGGSGPSYLAGWITSFCFFDYRDGKFIVNSQTKNSRVDSEWPIVDTNYVPSSYLDAPITFDIMGNVFKAKIIAGIMGSKVHSTDTDGICPSPGWLIAKATEGFSESITIPHHGHTLSIHRYTRTTYRCNVCRKSMGSIGYRCENCDFDCCDSCSKIAYDVSAPVDLPTHPHSLTWNTTSTVRHKCDVCKDTVMASSGAYRCVECNFDYCYTCNTNNRAQ